MLKFSHMGAWVLIAASAATVAVAQNSAADVYKAKCAMCHGVAGDGNTPAGKAFKAPSFSSPDVLKASDDELIAITKKGKEKMPAWNGKLTDDQIKDVIAYIHTLQKK
jgi:mono/diheme cytochrome c family protein